ncbi:flippase [Gracilibacillus massiliensis]|uniref:flippase n=1 Tax=Gracilibacillus massiliensis TaxID=1564956 RepID=UPI00071DB7C4|nr:flippase [Gracilibacillus massiliensis]
MKKILNTQLAKGLSGSFLIKVIGTILSFIISVILARKLGAEQYGYYAYALALITMLSIPTTMGIPNVVVKYVAKYKTKSEWGSFKGLINISNVVVSLISLTILFIAFLMTWIFTDNLSSIMNKTFLISLILLPILALSSLRSAILRGINRVVLGQLPENAITPILFFVFIIIYLIYDDINFNSQITMVIRVIAVFIAFIIGSIMLRYNLPSQLKLKEPNFEIKNWLKSTIPLLFVGGMMLINNRFDIFMLGIMHTSKEVGIYQVVMRSAELIIFALTVMNSVLAPKFSTTYTNKDMSKLQRIVTMSNRVVFLVSLPLSLVFIFFGNWLLDFIYGTEYSSGGTALGILAFGQLISTAFGSVGTLLNMTGYEKYSAYGVASAAICNIVLNLLFIPKWGINGAALATTVSLIFWNLLLAYWVRKKLDINTSIFWSNK